MKFFKHLSRREKIHLGLSYFLRLTIIPAIVSAAIKQQWLTLFLASLILFLTFLPSLIERNYKVTIPTEFALVVVLFVYTSLFLGEIHAYYTKFWWWDIILHGGAGLLFGFVGFLIMYTLNYKLKLKLKMAPGYVALFAFTFALASGVIWEIFEFGVDSLLGYNMQKSGLVDTMWDLIVDTVGAAVVALLGYLYLKKWHFPIFTGFIERFVEKNPGLFKVR
jgi:uncharacterized membrane protein